MCQGTVGCGSGKGIEIGLYIVFMGKFTQAVIRLASQSLSSMVGPLKGMAGVFY